MPPARSRWVLRLRGQLNYAFLEISQRLQGLRRRTHLGIAQHVLSGAHADPGQAARMAILVGQVTADGRRVAVTGVEVQQGVGQAPARQRGIRGLRLVEPPHDAGEVKLLDLVVTQWIAGVGVEVRHRVGDHLQVDHALVGGTAVPVLEGDLLGVTDVQDEIQSRLAQAQVAVVDAATQRDGVVGPRAGVDDILTSS